MPDALIRFYNGNYFATIKASSSLASNPVFTLPINDGNNGEFFKTDGNGVTSWAAVTSVATLTTARAIGGVNFNGSAAIVPTTIAVTDTTDTSTFVGLWTDATGDLLPKTDAALTYNAGTGALSATTFHGSGANLTNLPASGVTLNGTTDNALVTYDNGNTRLNTESTITYDGTNLSVGGNIVIGGSNSTTSYLIQFRDTSGPEYEIEYRNGGLNFSEQGVAHYRLHIKDDGDVTVLENTSSPSVVKGIAKAWGRVNGAGTLQAGDYNVASTTQNSTGRYTWTWTTAFENENYMMISDVNETTAAGVSVVDRAGNTAGAGKSSTYTQVHTSDGDDLGALPHHVVVFGEAT